MPCKQDGTTKVSSKSEKRFDTGAGPMPNGSTPHVFSRKTFTASHCFTLLRHEVEAHVQRINRGPDGDLISYDLTAKAQAQHQAPSMAHALAASELAPSRQIFPE